MEVFKIETINLLPAKYKTLNAKKIIIAIIIVLFLLAFGYIVDLVYDASVKKEALNNDLQIINAEISELNQLMILQEKLYTIKSEASALKTEYQDGRIYESQILKIIETIIPREMHITSINIDQQGQVQLNGCLASSYNVVVELMKNIKDIYIIENLELSSIVKEKTAESELVISSFPDRGDEYVQIGDITTTDFFMDTYAFSLSFRVISEGHSKQEE